jgi:hypothetical protein
MSSHSGEYGILILVVVFFGMFGVLLAFMPTTIFSNQGNGSSVKFPSSFVIGSSEYRAGYYYDNITNSGTTIWLNLTWRNPDDMLLFFSWDPAGLADGIWVGKPTGAYPYYGYYDPHPITLTYVSGLNMGNTTTFWLADPEHSEYNILCTIKPNINYTTLTNSWNAGQLQLYLGYPQNVTTATVSYSVWQIVGQMMSFQTPNVTNPIINAIIGVTIWAPILAAIILVLDKLIPF